MAKFFTDRLVAKAIVLLGITTVINTYMINKMSDDIYPTLHKMNKIFEVMDERLKQIENR